MKKYIYVGPEYTLVQETKDGEQFKVKQGEKFESEIEYHKLSRFILLEENYDPKNPPAFPFSQVDKTTGNEGGDDEGGDGEDQPLTIAEIKAKLGELGVEIPKGVTKRDDLLALLEESSDEGGNDEGGE